MAPELQTGGWFQCASLGFTIKPCVYYDMIKGSKTSLLQKIDIKEEITPEPLTQVEKNLLRFPIFKITVMKHEQLCKEKQLSLYRQWGFPYIQQVPWTIKTRHETQRKIKGTTTNTQKKSTEALNSPPGQTLQSFLNGEIQFPLQSLQLLGTHADL